MVEIAAKYQPIITLIPLRLRNVGIIITGNEVYKGIIKDGFSEVIHGKIESMGCTVNNERIVPDDSDLIARTILEFQEKSSEVILCCSGMSVDPDDVTPEGFASQERRWYFTVYQYCRGRCAYMPG